MYTVHDIHTLINSGSNFDAMVTLVFDEGDGIYRVEMNDRAISISDDEGIYLVRNDRIVQFDESIGCLTRLLIKDHMLRLIKLNEPVIPSNRVYMVTQNDETGIRETYTFKGSMTMTL